MDVAHYFMVERNWENIRLNELRQKLCMHMHTHVHTHTHSLRQSAKHFNIPQLHYFCKCKVEIYTYLELKLYPKQQHHNM